MSGARRWLIAAVAIVGGGLAIVAAFLQFGTGLSLTNELTGETINPQPTTAFSGLDDWMALVAGALMVLGAIGFLAFSERSGSLLSGVLAGIGALLALGFGIKLALDIGGGSDFPLQLQFTDEATGEVFTGVAGEDIAIGLWLLLAGGVIGLVGALMMLWGARRSRPVPPEPPPV